MRQAAGLTAGLLARKDAGSEDWWYEIAEYGTPVIESQPDSDMLRITFLWRDPQGGVLTSSVYQVFIDINGLTDHHSFTPESLQRLANSDIWYATFTAEADWRGSYCFIPITATQKAPEPAGTLQQQRIQQREWWCSLLPLRVTDPLNLSQPHFSSQNMGFSAVHMPGAPDQSAWGAVDRGITQLKDSQYLKVFTWHSTRLARHRRIWLWCAKHHQSLPLIIVLDGLKWAENMFLLPVVESLTTQGKLPPAAWLLIDSINVDIRSQELLCNADFWQAIQEELLPKISQYCQISSDPAHTIVAGQSYGGLAALYAGLFFPARFGCVLTQSGSFWWPDVRYVTHFAEREHYKPGWLTQQVTSLYIPRPLRIFQEVGLHEPDIRFVNKQMFQSLREAGHCVRYRLYNGGHDSLCWRGGLIDGTHWLLSDSPE